MNNKTLKQIGKRALAVINKVAREQRRRHAQQIKYRPEVLKQADEQLILNDFWAGESSREEYEEALQEVMSDLLVIDYLTAMSEDLDTVVLLEHTASFARMVDAAAFSIAIMQAGYTFEGFVATASQTHPLCIFFTHQGLLQAGEVCASTLKLLQMARRFNGSYEGWETNYSEETGLMPAGEVLARVKKLLH